MKNRIYTKEEVAQLLERTADLQRQEGRGEADRAGLTLKELETIASEAGLDAGLLRQAADELDQPHRSLFESSSGTTATHVFAERWVPGRFTPDVWEDIVAELRHRFDTTAGMSMGMPHLGLSTTETIGRTAEWRHTTMWGVETRIMMRQSGDRVRIRLSRKLGWASPGIEAFVLSSIPAVIAAFAAGISTGMLLWWVLAPLLTLAALVPGIAYLDRAWRDKKDLELEAIGDHIAHMVEVRRPTESDRSGSEAATASDEADALTETKTAGSESPRIRLDSEQPGRDDALRREKSSRNRTGA